MKDAPYYSKASDSSLDREKLSDRSFLIIIIFVCALHLCALWLSARSSPTLKKNGQSKVVVKTVKLNPTLQPIAAAAPTKSPVTPPLQQSPVFLPHSHESASQRPEPAIKKETPISPVKSEEPFPVPQQIEKKIKAQPIKEEPKKQVETKPKELAKPPTIEVKKPLTAQKTAPVKQPSPQPKAKPQPKEPTKEELIARQAEKRRLQEIEEAKRSRSSRTAAAIGESEGKHCKNWRKSG